MKGRATVLRSLLLLERHRKRTVVGPRKSPRIYDSCACVHCGYGQRDGTEHFAHCLVDKALTALGCPTAQSREASRRMLGITEAEEWTPPRVPAPDELINTL